MPELPEIDVTVSKLKCLIGSKILKIINVNDKFESNVSVNDVYIIDIQRSGKKINITLENMKVVQLSLGMTGYLQLSKIYPELPHLASIFIISYRNKLYYLSMVDERCFGSIRVLTDLQSVDEIYSKNGKKIFTNRLLTSKASVYPLLIDQHNAPGVGSYLAQESLWLSNIHPLDRELKHWQINLLHGNLCAVIKRSIRYGGATWDRFVYPDGTVGSYFKKLKIYGSNNLHCVKCNLKFSSVIINKRKIKFCQNCQSL